MSADQLEQFVVERIKGIGRDPALLADTIAVLTADREAQRPTLEKEQRMLQVELQAGQRESKGLVAALGGQSGGGRAITERLAEVDERAGQIDRRLTEIHEALLAIEGATVSPDEVARALEMFDPVWEALVPKEQANLLALLVERIDYDGQGGAVAITFRPTGIANLARGEERSAA